MQGSVPRSLASTPRDARPPAGQIHHFSSSTRSARLSKAEMCRPSETPSHVQILSQIESAMRNHVGADSLGRVRIDRLAHHPVDVSSRCGYTPVDRCAHLWKSPEAVNATSRVFCIARNVILLMVFAAGFAAAQQPPVASQGLHLGAAWYPEQWPESQWESDLQLMQDAPHERRADWRVCVVNARAI